MDFLPVDDPRVFTTVDRIEHKLAINGHSPSLRAASHVEYARAVRALAEAETA